MAAKRSEPLVLAGLNAIGAISVKGVQMSFTINTSPTCSLAYTVGTGVQNILSGDVAAELAKLQAANFGDRTTQDAYVIINDMVSGQTQTLTGLATGPAYSVFAGDVKKSAVIVGQVALLDSLNMSIYRYDHAAKFSSDKLNKGDSWAERILSAVDFLVDRGFKQFKDFSGADRERVAIKHTRNLTLGLPILRKILEDSKETTQSEGLKKLAGGEAGKLTINNGIANAILGALMAPSERFWQVLDQLCAMFHLIYIPDSLYGKLINASEAADSEAKELRLSITNIDFDDGGGGILPLQQVLVRMGGVTNFPKKPQPPQIIDGWPENPASSGIDSEVPLPGWLIPADKLGPGGTPVPVSLGQPGNKDPLDITTYKTGSNTIVNRARKAANPIIRELVREYARNLWIDGALSRSTAQFAISLNLHARPGYRYKVIDPLSGKTLFTGFLTAASHMVEVASAGGGGQGTQRTSVRFSHVEMGDFVLPGK